MKRLHILVRDVLQYSFLKILEIRDILLLKRLLNGKIKNIKLSGEMNLVVCILRLIDKLEAAWGEWQAVLSMMYEV